MCVCVVEGILIQSRHRRQTQGLRVHRLLWGFDSTSIRYDIKKHLKPPEQRFGGVIFLLEAWHFDIPTSSGKLCCSCCCCCSSPGGFDSWAAEQGPAHPRDVGELPLRFCSTESKKRVFQNYKFYDSFGPARVPNGSNSTLRTRMFCVVFYTSASSPETSGGRASFLFLSRANLNSVCVCQWY